MATRNLLTQLPPDGALEKHLPPFFKVYPDLDAKHPSAYFLWNEGGESVSHLYEVCHAHMSWANPGYDHLITAVPKSDELSLSYIKMLISGPFRSMADLISLEQVDGNYYLRCSELIKWPANVLFNFCIASRTPIEFPHYLALWVELVEKGYNPTLAFLLSYSTNGEGFAKKGYRTFDSFNHLWIDTSSDWMNVIQGDMIKLTPSFKEYPKGSRPCNIIWGTSLLTRKFSMMPDEDVANALKLPIEPPAPPPTIPKAMKDKIKEAGGIDAYVAQLQQAQPQPPQGAGNNVWGNNPFVFNANGLQQPPPPHHIIVQVDPDDPDDDDDEEDEEWEFIDPEDEDF